MVSCLDSNTALTNTIHRKSALCNVHNINKNTNPQPGCTGFAYLTCRVIVFFFFNKSKQFHNCSSSLITYQIFTKKNQTTRHTNVTVVGVGESLY